MKAKKKKRSRRIIRVLLALLLLIVVGLSILLYAPVKTLASLEKVDDFPLYVMRYHGTYFFDLFAEEGTDWVVYRKIYEKVNPDACTSFAALNPESEGVFGRNFDWMHRASLLLFTDPPNGYASVSMVDLFYLGLEGMQEIGWSRRFTLLGAPYATIDGMNECGVAIGQNAVPKREISKDPNKPTLLNSQLARLVLDHAKDVNEAIALITQYNAEFVIPVHFHIADASGNSAVVEYTNGKIDVVRNDNPWQVSTNFLISEKNKPDCWRYNLANESLSKTNGKMSQDEAMGVLEAAKLGNTVWSVVYNLSTGRVQLAMGKDYDKVHNFKLEMGK
jgi:predicted choloylglycine hydrolase